MEDFKKLLKAQGVSDETIGKVLAEMGTQKMYLTDMENASQRYNKLKGQNDTLQKQYDEASKLIETMKANGANAEDLQKKIGEYEATVKDLNAKLEQTSLDNAIKVALLEAKASDVDYLAYKLKEKGDIKLDENGKLKNAETLIGELKTAHPNQFEDNGKPGKNIDVKKLEDPEPTKQGPTKEQFEKMSYTSRVKLKKENPDLYKELTGKVTDTDTTTEE